MTGKQFFTPKKILIILVILCGLLVTSSFFTNSLVMPVRTVVAQIVVPLQRGMNAIGIGAVEKDKEKKNLKALKEENDNLTQRIEELEAENKSLKSNAKELETLREFYKLGGATDSYEKVGANIIGGSTQNWNSTFMIDKGSSDGIEVDMNVISKDGLVGIITEVHPNYSILMTVLADNSYVTAMDEKTMDQCMVKGNITLMDSGKIELEKIKSNASIAYGDIIVTSNLSSKYLPGIPIGTAQDIKTDETLVMKKGYLKPAVDFEHLQKVLIITAKKSVEKQSD